MHAAGISEVKDRQAAARLELRAIRKAYPTIVANDDIDLTVRPGEIHAVLGENGAGKSTLMKIIYGAIRPDAGDMTWDGSTVSIRTPADAQRLGIGMVFQHFALFDTLTAAQNICLAMAGKPKLDELSSKIVNISSRYGLPVDPDRLIHTMSVGERQRVEIIRCLLQNPRLLIMDEPTSVLNPHAVEQLFETLRQLASEGCSILYVSHKLNEIRALCDSATVLRAGKVTGICDPRCETTSSLARMMIGEDLPAFRHKPTTSEFVPQLVLSNLSVCSDHPFGVSLDCIDLTVHAGEIVGIAGVSGNGQQELLSAISGEKPLATQKTIKLRGVEAAHLGPRARRELGMAFVPEERLGRGAVPSLSLAENALLTASRHGMVNRGLIHFGRVNEFAKRCIGEYGVKCGGVNAPAASLSGGNLQKFIVGREVLQRPKVLVIAQPTWGVDVGAATFIRQALIDLRDSGTAILVISEELEELFDITDRIAVIAKGRLSPVGPTTETDVNKIGLAMTGLWGDGDKIRPVEGDMLCG